MLEELFRLVPDNLLEQSGRVAYAGREAFSGKASVYLLGLNPGGDPVRLRSETVAADMDLSLNHRPEGWSAYVDESWEGAPAGGWGLQPRVRHLCQQLNLDPRTVPSSNLIFVRTRRESGLGSSITSLAEACWPFHEAVIDAVDAQLIVCFGKTAGKLALKMLGGGPQVGTFVEQNGRRWTSSVHRSATGRYVATLTHPSIAAWNVAATDPTPMLRSFVA
jgi:hypothetical protein